MVVEFVVRLEAHAAVVRPTDLVQAQKPPCRSSAFCQIQHTQLHQTGTQGLIQCHNRDTSFIWVVPLSSFSQEQVAARAERCTAAQRPPPRFPW